MPIVCDKNDDDDEDLSIELTQTDQDSIARAIESMDLDDSYKSIADKMKNLLAGKRHRVVILDIPVICVKEEIIEIENSD